MTFQTGKKLQEYLDNNFTELMDFMKNKILENRDEDNLIGHIDEWLKKHFGSEYLGYNVINLNNFEIPQEFYFYDFFPDVSILATPNLYCFNFKDKVLWIYFRDNFMVFNMVLEYII